ncbi:hypothetical protein JTE90_019561 [Oedothorax gibbosus]|uniref:Uncharacterized protein n=1 Tax=Oedothorax gibbosus TaxID=931172 RepID=A0AAV6V4U0_9ARAC|nr:hypothetical protein JTE90_019561 [Oedothorax gibbosus]
MLKKKIKKDWNLCFLQDPAITLTLTTAEDCPQLMTDAFATLKTANFCLTAQVHWEVSHDDICNARNHAPWNIIEDPTRHATVHATCFW